MRREGGVGEGRGRGRKMEGGGGGGWVTGEGLKVVDPVSPHTCRKIRKVEAALGSCNTGRRVLYKRQKTG